MPKANKKMRNAAPLSAGDLSAIQTAAVQSAAANASDLASAQTLANDLKAKFNALVAAIDAA